MNLRNRTSGVSIFKSVSDIERLLMEAGAVHISKFVDGGNLIGMAFQLIINGDPVLFKLPAKVEAVEKVMIKGLKRPRRETLKRMHDQAERTAWKLLLDWISVQLSMIQMEQVEPAEVFLPYVYNPQKGQTFFRGNQRGWI